MRLRHVILSDWHFETSRLSYTMLFIQYVVISAALIGKVKETFNCLIFLSSLGLFPQNVWAA